MERTLQRGMKREAPAPDEQVSGVGDEEDAVVPLGPAGVHALEGEADEQEVGEGVDDFGGVGRRVVVLPVQFQSSCKGVCLLCLVTLSGLLL